MIKPPRARYSHGISSSTTEHSVAALPRSRRYYEISLFLLSRFTSLLIYCLNLPSMLLKTFDRFTTTIKYAGTLEGLTAFIHFFFNHVLLQHVFSPFSKQLSYLLPIFLNVHLRAYLHILCSQLPDVARRCSKNIL